MSATATSTRSGLRYMIWAISNLFRKPGVAFNALSKLSQPVHLLACRSLDGGDAHVRMDSTTSIPAFWKSLTYSKVDWYTLAVRYQRERGGVHVGRGRAKKEGRRRGQEGRTDLLSGAGGTPGACRAAMRRVWTSVGVRASPSANSGARSVNDRRGDERNMGADRRIGVSLHLLRGSAQVNRENTKQGSTDNRSSGSRWSGSMRSRSGGRS